MTMPGLPILRGQEPLNGLGELGYGGQGCTFPYGKCGWVHAWAAGGLILGQPQPLTVTAELISDPSG